MDYNRSRRNIVNPTRAAAYCNRGYAYDMLGKYDLALADLKVYARLAGENADPRVNTLIAQIKVKAAQNP